jgi:hypothetical protein
MSKMDNNPQLDERIWQAWIQKNAAQDQVRFRRRVKVIGLVSLCLALSALLFEIHKVRADVFQLRPMPAFRSKTVLEGSSIARTLVQYRSLQFSDLYGSLARSSFSSPNSRVEMWRRSDQQEGSIHCGNDT